MLRAQDGNGSLAVAAQNLKFPDGPRRDQGGLNSRQRKRAAIDSFGIASGCRDRANPSWRESCPKEN